MTRIAIAWAVAAVACGAPTDGVDVDAPDLPEACRVAPAPDGWSYPAGPYGAGELGDVFEDIALDDCDGNPVRLGDLLWAAKLVHVNVGAGWCQPCIDETEVAEATIHRPLTAPR